MTDLESEYVQFIIDHPDIDEADLLLVFPTWRQIVQSREVVEAIARHKIERIKADTKAKKRTQELRQYADEARRKAIAGLVQLMDSNDEKIRLQACAKLSASITTYQNKKAEKEAESEFEKSLPKDEQYPDV